MSGGILGEDSITSDEYIEELEMEVSDLNDTVDLLVDRLEELGEDTCTCNACKLQHKIDQGEKIH